MQPVSKTYKAQMKKNLRNPSYVWVSYGVFNLQAEKQAKFSDNGHAVFSRLTINDDFLPNKEYITLEKDYWRVDGTQLILPNQGSYDYDGYVSNAVSNSNNTFSNNPMITIDFADSQSIYGLTFTFLDYPKEIKVNGKTYYPNSDKWEMPDKLLDVRQIKIEFVKAHFAGRRIRLNRIQFGRKVIFDNRTLIKTSYSSMVDFVSLSLTNKRLSFTIDNFNQRYNPLNPDGLYAFLETKQPADIDYGYQLDNGTIEKVHGDSLVLESTPIITQNQANFSAVDSLSNLTGIFRKGLFRPGGITLYELAEEVLKDADVKHYIIDKHLKEIKTKAALPIATHRECLQIIANAGQCILYTDRNGYIKLEIALDPIIRVRDNGHMPFSNSESAYNDEELPQKKYIDLLPNSWNTGKVILPKKGPFMRQGFISDKVCNKNGEFSEYPIYYWTYSFPYSVYQIPITFDNVDNEYATEFDVVYKLNREEKDRFSVKNSSVTCVVEHNVYGVDCVEIEIHKWSKGIRRATINQIGYGRINDMNIDFNTMANPPIVEKSSQVKSVEVTCYNYAVNEKETELYKEKIRLNGSETLHITHDAAIDISAAITNGTILEQEHYTYYSVVTLTGNGEAELILKGKKFTTSSVGIIKQINPTGEIKSPLKNPLITDIENAKVTATWIADYFSKRNYLSTEYRGNPEIDAHDLIYMESQFQPLFPVRIKEHKIEFNGALSGTVKAVVM